MHEDEAGELVARLAAIGLGEREAKLYVDLLVHGVSRASDAAARVNLKRTETYRALEALMKEGFVVARLTRPVEYEPAPPGAVFDDLLARHEQRRAHIETLRERAARLAQETRANLEAGDARHGYRILQGRRAILAAGEAAMRHARDRLLIASPFFSHHIAPPTSALYQTLLQAARKGIRIDLLLGEHEGFERAYAPLLGHRHVRLRTTDVPRGFRILLVDERELLFWLASGGASGPEERQDVAMWTNTPDLAHAQRTFFELLWTRADERVPTAA